MLHAHRLNLDHAPTCAATQLAAGPPLGFPGTQLVKLTGWSGLDHWGASFWVLRGVWACVYACVPGFACECWCMPYTPAVLVCPCVRLPVCHGQAIECCSFQTSCIRTHSR